MKIHHLRNATFIIQSGKNRILVDPMLSPKGALPPFSFFRHRFFFNPLVDLPENTAKALEKVNLCLITHSQKWGFEPLTHTDHLDGPGRSFLRRNRIPVICHTRDRSYLEKHGIHIMASPGHWQDVPLFKGSLLAVPAKHGHGIYHRLMANGSGFHLRLPGEPSIYISGDTVLTPEVLGVLGEQKPDIAVVAAGGAQMDLGGPILMTLKEVVAFVKNAPGIVVANHMDALNHCPVTRSLLRGELEAKGLASKVVIPRDGEILSLPGSSGG